MTSSAHATAPTSDWPANSDPAATTPPRPIRFSDAVLRSRVGRRIFVLFLSAAVLPLAMLAGLSYEFIADFSAKFDRRELNRAAKHQGMQTLERLIAAKALLASLAAVPPGDAAARPALNAINTHATGIFDAVARVDAAAGPQAVEGHWDRRFESLLGTSTDLQDATKVRLVLLPGIGTQRHTPTLALRDARGALWVATLSAAYLWPDGDGWNEGQRFCAFGSNLALIYCSPDEFMQDAVAALRPGSEPGSESVPPTGSNLQPYEPEGPASGSHVEDLGRASWELFLRGEFVADNWIFVRGQSGSYSVSGSVLALRGLLPPVAVATLLIVAILSLILIRRTMGPLERLTTAIRTLGPDGEVEPVSVASNDEFGELACVFNDMTRQMREQFRGMAVLSSIDRDILLQRDPDGVLDVVATRLRELAPYAQVYVGRVEAGDAPRMRGVLRTPAWDFAEWMSHEVTPAQLDSLRGFADGGLVELPAEAGAHWLHAVQAQGAWQALCICAMVREEPAAVVAIDVPGPGMVDAELMRRARELRDRIAVAVAANARERELIHRAVHDSLTGLANRAGLGEELNRCIEQAQRDGDRVAVLFIDLDHFKTVNDTHGHEAGDEVLCLASRRLQSALPRDGVLARHGGDEFVVILPGLRDAQAAEKVGRSICLKMTVPFPVREQSIFLGASVGIAMYPEHGHTPDELLRCADIALYRAKQEGRGQVSVHDTDRAVATVSRVRTVSDLHLALPRGELRLHYQPRVEAATGRVASAEALLRWMHPARGLLSPGEFVLLAEEAGLIEDIGAWVLAAACEQLSQWRLRGHRLDRIAVNVSARQLRGDRFVREVEDALAQYGLRPGELEIEVTESLSVDDSGGAIDTLRHLHQRGVVIAIDDFGTGYSSLAYLHRVPFDVIKVDQSFVRNLGRDASSDSIAAAILALGRSLDRRVVAEGVETIAQATQLVRLGCHELQGYLYGRPMEPSAFFAAPASRKRMGIGPSGVIQLVSSTA